MTDSLYARALSPDQRLLFKDALLGSLDEELRLARVRLYHHTLRASCSDEDIDGGKNTHTDMMLKLMAMIGRLELARAALLRAQDKKAEPLEAATLNIDADEDLPDEPVL